MNVIRPPDPSVTTIPLHKKAFRRRWNMLPICFLLFEDVATLIADEEGVILILHDKKSAGLATRAGFGRICT